MGNKCCVIQGPINIFGHDTARACQLWAKFAFANRQMPTSASNHSPICLQVSLLPDRSCYAPNLHARVQALNGAAPLGAAVKQLPLARHATHSHTSYAQRCPTIEAPNLMWHSKHTAFFEVCGAESVPKISDDFKSGFVVLRNAWDNQSLSLVLA